MAIELKIPSFGESVTEAYLGDWLKNEGDAVVQDEPLVVLETDKVTAELPAPAAGVITKILKPKGETATVGEVIGLMEERDAAPATTAPTEVEPSPAPAPAAATPDARVMPAARRALAEQGVEPGAVTPTGPGGRLLKEDVLGRSTSPPSPAAPSPRPTTRPPSGAPTGSREEEMVPMSRIRLRIAERLVAAQQTAALLTTFNEIDMSAVKTLRQTYKESFEKAHGVKLGFMSFFVKAAVDALRLFPQVNAWIDAENNIVYHNYYDIGVAVGGGRGLVVPVIRNAERLSFAEVEATITDLAERAQANTLELDELQGGTFTISNGGVYGSLLSTPIVNPPQTAILGLHAIQDRPVAIDGEVVARPMMYVAVTYDHRLIDGREAVQFLRRIKDVIENPTRMLLEI